MDWYTVGILFYDMVSGEPPFYHDDADEHQRLTLKSDLKQPDSLSDEGYDLIKQLL